MTSRSPLSVRLNDRPTLADGLTMMWHMKNTPGGGKQNGIENHEYEAPAPCDTLMLRPTSADSLLHGTRGPKPLPVLKRTETPLSLAVTASTRPSPFMSASSVLPCTTPALRLGPPANPRTPLL